MGSIKTYCFVAVMLLLPLVAGAQLRLVAPNGGEILKVGSKTTIQWTGIAATDVVTLEYSTNNGTNWNLITNSATGLQYTWLNIPNTISPTCLVRVTHSTTVVPGTLRLPGGGSFRNANFSDDGKFVVAAGSNGNALIWDSYTAQVLHTYQTQTSAGIPNLFALNFWADFSPDGKTFATVSPSTDSNNFGNILRIFDVNTGTKLKEWNHRSEKKMGYSSGMCRFSPDGTKIGLTGKDSIYIFDVATQALISKSAGFALYVDTNNYGSSVPYAFDWSSDGTQIIVCSAFQITTFPHYVRNNAATGDTIKTYRVTTKIPFLSLNNSIHFSPDGTRFIAATEDTTVRVWDVASGQILFQIKSNLREVNDAVFSHDGKSIATVGYDSLGINSFSVKLWDATNGAFIRTVGVLGLTKGTIEFNFDDSRILVSGNTSAFIFQNPSGGNEFDQSDGNFSIIANTGGNIVVYTNDQTAKTNDVINIPILIDDPGSAIAGGATQVTIDFEYNATMLEPIGMTPKGTITNGKRKMSLTLPINPNDTVLTRLQMRVALGNDSVTKLDVIAPTTNAPLVIASDLDGSFKLLDLCTQGGARLINPDGIATMIVTAPNPTRTFLNIDLTLIEDGKTSLILSDITGRKIKTIFDEEVINGKRALQLPVGDLSSGRYYLTLQTPTFRKTTTVEVAR